MSPIVAKTTCNWLPLTTQATYVQYILSYCCSFSFLAEMNILVGFFFFFFSIPCFILCACFWDYKYSQRKNPHPSFCRVFVDIIITTWTLLVMITLILPNPDTADIKVERLWLCFSRVGPMIREKGGGGAWPGQAKNQIRGIISPRHAPWQGLGM